MIRITQILVFLAAVTPAVFAQAHTFDELKITEVSLTSPQGVELTNFDNVAVDLTGWVVLWDGGTLQTSAPLSGLLQPGHSVIVTEANPATIPEKPAGVAVLAALPFLSIGTQALSVGLRRPDMVVQDEVHIADLVNGTNTHPGFGSPWRGGVATRGSLFPHASVERIWGLDSNAGRDWTGETQRSLGLENTSAGTRGTEPDPNYDILITEVDDSPDFIEIYNDGYSVVPLNGWQLKITSAGSEALIAPFPGNCCSLGSGQYLVFGMGLQPAELPGGVQYVNVALHGGSLALNSFEYEIALYDQYGRLVDLMRASGGNDTVVQNHPRAPSAWYDFNGAALRLSTVGGGSICRRISNIGIIGGTTPYFDNGTGADWQPCFTRTMGSINAGWVGELGMSARLDVRANETALGNGMAIILNAGSSHAGERYSFLFSLGHQYGAGPLWGLGFDALANWLTTVSSPVFSGTLGPRGEGRIDLPSGSLPGGLGADAIFILQDPANGNLLSRSPIVMFDT